MFLVERFSEWGEEQAGVQHVFTKPSSDPNCKQASIKPAEQTETEERPEPRVQVTGIELLTGSREREHPLLDLGPKRLLGRLLHQKEPLLLVRDRPRQAGNHQYFRDSPRGLVSPTAVYGHVLAPNMVEHCL